MPYIELGGTSDRLGGNLTEFLGQIIFAHFNKYEIRYKPNDISSLDGWSKFNANLYSSIFIETLLEYIDTYNIDIIKDDIQVSFFKESWWELISQVVLNVGMDYVSYFKLHLADKIMDIFKRKVKEKGYTVPFNIENTVLIHLRLNDVYGRPDYDGRICHSHFADYLNKDILPDINLDNYIRNTYGSQYNSQSPIPYNRIEEYISNIKMEYPESEFVFVTSPNENVSEIPYTVLSNYDESYDLFLLCNAKKVVLSRSTFSIISLFFGNSDVYYLPLWGHASCYGLGTKFDKNQNIKYTY